MNLKTTLVLLVLVVLGGAVVFLYPKDPGATSSTVDTNAVQNDTRPVFDPPIAENQIAKLVIERQDKPRMVFERAPKPSGKDDWEDWRIVEPVAAPAETWAVLNAARNLASLNSLRRFEPGAPGAVTAVEAGLDTPRAVVTLGLRDGKEHRYEVGRTAILSTDTYVRVANAKDAHIVRGDLVRDFLGKDLKDFRSKTLVKLNSTDAVRVQIEHDGKSYDFRKGADGQWVIDSPFKGYADKDKLIALLNKLPAVATQDFIEDAPASLASYGLDAPFLKFTVTTETQRPLPPATMQSTQPAEPQFETVTNTAGFVVGGFADMKSENRFAKLLDQPFVVSVPKARIDDLIPKPLELRDKRITRVRAGDAQKLELAAGDMQAVVEKKNGVWTGAGDLEQLELEAVQGLVQAFDDVQAIEFVDQPEEPGRYGFDPPRVSLTVTASGQVQPVTLEVGTNTPSGRNAYSRVVGRPEVYVISAAQAERLVVTPLSLRSRAMVTARMDDLKRITVERGGATYSATSESGPWRLTTPADATIDLGSIRELATTLSRLRAKTVVGKGNFAEYGLDQPGVTVTFAMTPPADPATTQATQPAAPVEHTLRVAWHDNAAYARKDDDPYVFQLDETVYRVLTTELLKREVFDFKPDDVTALRVAAPQGKLELAHHDGVWTYTLDPSVKLAQKKVKDFLGELSRLRVESYLAYADGDLAAEGLEDAPVVATITLKNDRTLTLHVGQERPNALPRKAALVESKRIFMLRPADAEKILRSVDYYIETEADRKPPTVPPSPNEAFPPGDE
ncbi:MAG: DUF4340 domain-containing protein [Phycisphaerae bacterium]